MQALVLQMKYRSTRLVSHFLSLFGIEVHDLLACPTDTVPHIFNKVILQRCFRFRAPNLIPLSSALEAVWSLDLPSVFTKAFRSLSILISERSFTPLDNFKRKSRCCYRWKCSIYIFLRFSSDPLSTFLRLLMIINSYGLGTDFFVKISCSCKLLH